MIDNVLNEKITKDW